MYGVQQMIADRHRHWVEGEQEYRGWDGLHHNVCEFCGAQLYHWVARDTSGKARQQDTPFYFATLAEAEAARDELAT